MEEAQLTFLVSNAQRRAHIHMLDTDSISPGRSVERFRNRSRQRVIDHLAFPKNENPVVRRGVDCASQFGAMTIERCVRLQIGNDLLEPREMCGERLEGLRVHMA